MTQLGASLVFAACLIQASLAMNYSSKTPYAEVFNAEQLEFINNPQNYRIENCEPEQIFVFSRHGARNPSTSQVLKSKTFLDKLAEYKDSSSRKEILDELYVSFENTPHFGLTELGAEEMHQIGARFKKRFASLFAPLETQSDPLGLVSIVSSSRERSIDSGKNFLYGLYGNRSRLAEALIHKIVVNDTMMRLFDSCGRYVHDVVKANKLNASAEMPKYKYGKEMNSLVEMFKLRNDITDMPIKSDILLKLFTLCNIEDAHKMKENWCLLFDKKDYEILSYYYDLKAYWVKSYGNQLNPKMMFLFIQDMFEEMDRAIQNEPTKRQVLLRFGHAENMFPLIAAMGLFKDAEILRHDNFAAQAKRRFRTGRMSPFSANMAFVLHKCKPTLFSETRSVYDDYKVSLLVNEMPIELYGLNEKLACARGNEDKLSTCDFREFKRLIRAYLNDNLDDVCLPGLYKRPKSNE